MKKGALCVVMLALALSALGAQQKYALVIGNGAYQKLANLKNPENDANDMKAALQELGFTVDTLINSSRVQMEQGIERFKGRLSVSKNSYGFLFYAGHGVQSRGTNYLIPVDADIISEAYLGDRAVSLQAILDEINQAGNELNIVVLDAGRDTPFGWDRSGIRGLQVVSNQPADSIIVYASSAGSAAADGEGRNGVFTGQLLKNISTPGLEVSEIFRLTMGGVIQASGGQQRPVIYSKFPGIAYLSRQTPAGMVRIQGGYFAMGSPIGEAGRDDDEVQHQVAVSGFYMGKYEVTQQEYEAVMGTRPSNWEGPNLPVEKVSWFDAVEYCNKRSRKEDLTEAYTITGSGDKRTVTWNKNASGYRLPTEAEWEYACRAGTTGPYYSGISVDSAGWHSGNNGDKTHPAGEKQENAWGLYDMHGNVQEWCWDWFGSYTSGEQIDPEGASSGPGRVFRGGSWHDFAQFARSASRGYSDPSARGNNLGFRVVRPLETPQSP